MSVEGRILNHREHLKFKFPHLMKYRGGETPFIALMSEKSKGMVVQSDNPHYPVGRMNDGWNMNWFEPFCGTVSVTSE